MSDTPHEFQYAHKLGIETLYKFQKYSTPVRRGYVRDTLARNSVYFSRPSELNDKDDLRPLIKIKHEATPEITRAKFLEATERHIANQSPPLEAEHAERIRHRMRTESFAEIERTGNEDNRERMEQEYFILCMTTRRDSVRMWREYGGKSTGVCIHFSAELFSPFAFCQRVDYQPDRAPIWFPQCQDAHETARCATLVKTRRWRRENEFRFIRYPGVPFREIDFHISGQFGTFQPQWVTAVTVGHAMAKDAAAEIIDMAKRHPPPLPVFRMRKDVRAEPERLA